MGKVFQDLISTDYGLMSLIGILFMIGMGIFFLRLFMSKVNESEQAARQSRPPQPPARRTP